jgi:hypothetical protein
MKRADVKAGVLYAVKHGEPVMVVDEALWAEDWSRAGSTYRPARAGEKSTKSVPGYGHTTVGLPAMVRSPLMMPNPEYVGEAEYDRLATELGVRFWHRAQTDTRLQDEIPDPLRWEWKPTILEPRDALAPLDEHEATRRAEQERRNEEREAHRREYEDRMARLAAIADVLSLTEEQRCHLIVRPTEYSRGHVAEVTLEWLEEVASRLRQGSRENWLVECEVCGSYAREGTDGNPTAHDCVRRTEAH